MSFSCDENSCLEGVTIALYYKNDIETFEIYLILFGLEKGENFKFEEYIEYFEDEFKPDSNI